MVKKYKRIRVTVTRDDLEQARRGHSQKCAVARALARAFPDIRNPEVDTAAVRYSDADGRWWWATPIAVAQYVSDYDLGLPIGDEAIPGVQCGAFTFYLRDAVRAPQRRQTVTGKQRTNQYNAQVRAVREHAGLNAAQWNALARAERRTLVEQAKTDGMWTAPVGERTGVEPVKTPGGDGLNDERRNDVIVAADHAANVRQAPPRVYRSVKRMYGQRILRWNRPAGDEVGGAVV